ncbi:MAG TPA: malonyl-ACP O-methyltransferase BioC [Rhodanobacteraceae bacterium]|nr:malonyl-ACP O-methyltransferase BioC [Rhodanobacteraceae bacterium]
MSAFRFDRKQVQRAFGRAAKSYEENDSLQRRVQSRLIERLDYYEGTPACVLDLGCGTGRGAAILKRRWPRAQVIALDIALPMLRAARRHAGWMKPFLRVCGDALALPLADRSVDVLHSSLCIQWCESPRELFTEFARVLKPGGFMAVSSLGPDTLHELRQAWAIADNIHSDIGHPHVSRFLDMHDLGDAAIAAGLRDPVLDADHLMSRYAHPRDLLRELKGLGATNADSQRERGLTGKARFARMFDAYDTLRVDGVIPATWEVIELHAWGPPEGQPRRAGGEEIATFPIERLRGAQR